MTTNLEAAPSVVSSPEVETADVRERYREELAAALAIICLDSRVAPSRYLEETMVPHGGE